VKATEQALHAGTLEACAPLASTSIQSRRTASASAKQRKPTTAYPPLTATPNALRRSAPQPPNIRFFRPVSHLPDPYHANGVLQKGICGHPALQLADRHIISRPRVSGGAHASIRLYSSQPSVIHPALPLPLPLPLPLRPERSEVPPQRDSSPSPPNPPLSAPGNTLRRTGALRKNQFNPSRHCSACHSGGRDASSQGTRHVPLQVQGAHHLLPCPALHRVRIDHGRLDIGVAQQFLNGPQIHVGRQ
jgi:hypothetical protein